MNLTELRAARPELLHTAAQQFARLTDTSDSHADRIRVDVRRPHVDGSWQGTASEAAWAYTDQLLERWHRATARMREVSKAVRRFADAIASAQAALSEIERTAARAGLGLEEDGDVQLPPGALFDDDNADVRATAGQVGRALSDVLATATQADADCAAVLGLAPPSGDDDGSLVSWGTVEDAVGWYFDAKAVIDSVNHIYPGAKIPVPGDIPLIETPLDVFLDVKGAAEEWGNLNDPDTRRDGFGAFAQAYKMEFNLASVAFTVAPSFPTAVAVVATAALWGGCNFLDMHGDTIADAWSRANETGWGAVGWGVDKAGDFFDDPVGTVGDTLSSIF